MNAPCLGGRTEQQKIELPERQLAKFGTSFPRRQRGSELRLEGNNSSSLPPMRSSELRRATQEIVLQYPTEQIVAESGLCVRAVENQKNGESALSFLAAINWARRNPRFRAQIMRLLGCGDEADPDFQQGFQLLMQALVRGEPEAIDTTAVQPAPAVGDLLGGTR